MPLHKRNFSLLSGACASDDQCTILVFDARPAGTNVEVRCQHGRRSMRCSSRIGE
jgi:nitrite reductase/ring-hydroxylating ferredoxin subunit